MSETEIQKIEDLINEKIWRAEAVAKKEMKKDEAISAGAIAFFGEKYGERVRVVRIGDFSTELCGGTHVDNASEIHLFKIANESGIAAGVRRIVAYTSKGAFQYLRSKDQEVKAIRDRLKASSSDEILGKLDKMSAVEKELRKQIEQAQSKSAGEEVNDLITKALSLSQGKAVVGVCAPDAQGVKRLREVADRVKQKVADSVIVLGMKDPSGGKASLLVTLGPKAPAGVNANEILQKIAPLIEGRGGGKPDLAQAGGTKPAGLDPALEEARRLLSEKLK